MTTESPAIGSEEEFEAFGPRLTPSGDFWQYAEIEMVPTERVWSILETGEANQSLVASPGWHTVNVLGYVVTDKPWTDGVNDYYWFEDDRETYTAELVTGQVVDEVGDNMTDAAERIELIYDTKVLRISLAQDWDEGEEGEDEDEDEEDVPF
jgi:hypothetical protein